MPTRLTQIGYSSTAAYDLHLDPQHASLKTSSCNPTLWSRWVPPLSAPGESPWRHQPNSEALSSHKIFVRPNGGSEIQRSNDPQRKKKKKTRT